MTLHVGHYSMGQHRMSILQMILGVIVIPTVFLLILFAVGLTQRPW